MSAETTQEIYNKYSAMLTGIGCFKGTFSLQVRNDVKTYLVPLRCTACTLHEPFKELEKLQEHQILGVDETAEWCNSFVTVPKPNITLCLCLNCM